MLQWGRARAGAESLLSGGIDGIVARNLDSQGELRGKIKL